MYYRNVRGYTNLPYYWWNQYDWISWYMGAPGPIPPFAYGIGFVQFTQAFGYNIFGHVDDYFVTGGDYWHRTADIDNGWPVAIYSNNFYYPPGGPDTDSPHWVAMRGYQWYDNQYVIECTDSFRGTSTLWLNFNHLGFGIVTVTIKD